MNLIKKIIDSDLDIDIYGRNLNLSDKRYKGSPDNKHEILKNYQYSIAIENSCEENYVSEKFFDCILNNVVPLYYGCPNIDSIFNSKCYKFLDINDNKVINNIKNICLKDSKDFEKDVLDAKNKYFETYNPIIRITNEIKCC